MIARTISPTRITICRRRSSMPASGFGTEERAGRTAVVMSRALRLGLGDDAGGSEDQHEDEQREHDDRRPLGLDEAVGHGRDDADQDAADRRTGEVADAPDDR